MIPKFYSLVVFALEVFFVAIGDLIFLHEKMRGQKFFKENVYGTNFRRFEALTTRASFLATFFFAPALGES